MKSMDRKSKLSVLMCLLSFLSTSVFALDEVAFDLSADYYGKYIWRGQNQDDDPAFQPGFSATFKGFTAGIWGSLETTDIHDSKGEFREVDYYADYSADVPGIEGLGFSIGAIYYDFPNTTVPSTTELYWGFSLDTLLSPSVTFYHDIDEADGLYISAGIGHSFDFGEDVPVAIDLGASLGWGDGSYNKYYWMDSVTELPIKDSGFNDLSLSASFPFEVGGWSITPSVNYVMLVDSDIKSADTYNKDSSAFFVGIGFSRGF